MTHSVLETRGHMRRELLLLDMPVLTARARAGGVPEDRIRAALTTPPVRDDQPPRHLIIPRAPIVAPRFSPFVPRLLGPGTRSQGFEHRLQVPNYLGFRPGDLEASDVSAFVPDYLQENPHFAVEYHTSICSWLCCGKRKKGSRLSAHHKLFWNFPGGVTDWAFPLCWYVEMPDRPKRGEPLYTQVRPTASPPSPATAG